MQQSNGIVLGIVSSLEDPDSLGRVQVKFPHLDDQRSNWARIASPMAGKERGMFFRPEVDDLVLVAFEHSDVRRPYIIGSVWSTEDKPPPDDGQPKKNNWRFFRSRSGHIFRFDDTDGSEKIEIIANDEKRRIVIDTSGDKIEISCDDGAVEIKAGGNVKIVGNNVEVKSQGDMKLEAAGTMTIKGSTVNIN